MRKPLLIGITGGSGSGKSWLARAVDAHFGPGLASHLELDWYYKDLSRMDRELAAQTNFDHPDSLELDLLERQLTELAAGKPVEAPQYDFSRFSRREATKRIDPTALIIVEGLFVLETPSLAQLFDVSVFVDTPSDIRLLRRIRRDLSERGYDLDRILQFWENNAHPMFERFVRPQRDHASRIWYSLEDKAFVPRFMADLEGRLARNADQPTPKR